MAKLSILAGATSQSVNVFIQNSSVTTGAGLTGLVFNTSNLIAYYSFAGTNAASTQISLVTLAAVNSAFSSGGFKEIDATNMPGLYRLDVPNAAIAGAKGRSVVVMLTGAANMAPCVLEIELTAVDNQSAAFGLSLAKTTNITGFNDIAATAIVSSGAITTSSGAVSSVTTTTTATNLTNAPTAGDFTATMKTSLNAATPASVTGAVGSVTGAVGSVTGNVGGNVVGSVASVTAAVTVDGTSPLTEAYAAQGAALTLSKALYGINQFLGQHAIAGTLWTVKKRDGSTTAKTYTLDSATAPTTISETT